MQRVESAEFVKYNANARGNNAPDCVKRAISLAFDISYNQISRELLDTAKKNNSLKWNVSPIYDKVIINHGGVKHSISGNRIRVEDFIDRYCTVGTYILQTSASATGPQHHLVCVIDGKLYDSWNSLNEYVVTYYTVTEESTSHQFTDIKEHMTDLSEQAIDYVINYGQKYLAAHEMSDCQLSLKKSPVFKDYTFTLYFEFHIDNDMIEYNATFSIAFVFTPTTTLEDAQQYIKKTAQVRTYDRLHTIDQKISSTYEGLHEYKKAGYAMSDIQSPDDLMLNGRERRFHRSLPGWARLFIQELSIYDPGQYFDSYELTLLPLSGDPDKSPVKFYGYDSSQILDELKRYKINYSRIDKDYGLDDVF